MNTKGEFSGKIIEKLSMQNISLNITAIMTSEQVKKLLDFLNPNSHSIISVFAGRIADTGVDPEEVMRTVKELLKNHSNAELLWASPRELYNIYQAENCDCDIITIPHALTKKFSVINKDLIEYSKETVEMFYNDALESNFNIDT
jgi:transaldolase